MSLSTPQTPPISAAGRFLWNLGGLACVATGTLGIFLPGLPTTIFLIVACICFSKANPERLEWIRNHPLYGPYLRRFSDGGFTRKKRLTSLAMMWTMSIFSSTLLWAVSPWISGTIILLTCIGTVVIIRWPK